MITNFNYFLITEIADTVVEPDISNTSISINQSVYWINIKDRKMLVQLQLSGNVNAAILKIDFMLQVGEREYSSMKTNEGDPLLVMANVVGVIKKWLSLDIKQSFSGELVNFSNITLIGFWINAKSEEENDKRRSNIYKYYLTKNFEKLGIKVIEEKDITDSWNKKYNISKDEKYIFMQYEIEPIKIEEIKKRL